MKKIYFLLLTLLISFVSFGQTQIYQENFENAANGTNYTTDVLEFTDGFNDFFTTTDGTNITTGYQVTGIEGNNFFAAMDLDAEGGPAVTNLSTIAIDVTGQTSVDFVILLAEDDDGTNEDWDAADYTHITYSIDGGTSQNLLWIESDIATGSNGVPKIDTDFDGIGDGAEITSAFTEYVNTIALSGASSITFNIEFSLNSGDEDIAIDNIRVFDTFNATPSLSITAPSAATVFAPGTTNVDVTWTTANLAGGESVNITVNGIPTSNVTSPFSIATTDGQAYSVVLELVNAGGTLDSQTTDFTVSGLVSVTDITALRADVDANGLGRFYEITGASLVTHTDGFQNRKWIEDTNISGILIYDTAGTIVTTYAVGDLVTGLKGTTDESNGVLRFIPDSDAGTIMSSGNTVTPQIISIPDFNASPDDYESELISFTNVSFDEGNGTDLFTTGANYTLNDGSATTVKRTDFFSADYIGEIIPSTVLPSVIGVAGEFNGVAQIYVRSLEDLTLSTTVFETTNFSLYPNPTNTGFVNITTTANQAINITVFNVLGKQVLTQTVNNNNLDVSNLNAGVYILQLNQNGATTTKKLVIK